jgi:hypothetical protein
LFRTFAMLRGKSLSRWLRVIAIAGVFAAVESFAVAQTSQPPATTPAVKPIGTVKAISGNNVTLATDSGLTLEVTIQASARILRTLPGQKTLQGATQITLQDLKVGDRMVVAHGTTSEGGKSMEATVVFIMTAADVAAKQEQEQEDWNKRGTGGLVKSVDAANGTVTITVSGVGGSKAILLHVSKSTIIRRYAPDSVKFDDAKPGMLEQIQPGDQLRARGTKNVDGTAMTADEIVSGKFRNVAGTVETTDKADNSVTVMDLLTKSRVTLKIGADSQMRNLPPMVAERIAMRLKGGPNGASNGSNGSGQGEHQGFRGGEPSGNGGAHRPGGSPDFQQILERMPAVTLADLQKGTVVMAVATEGSPTTQPTAITLLTGVEPILTASPDSKGAAMMLSPWNLGGGGAEAAGANP